MPNITLPTEAERAAVDLDSFTWSNSEPGALTKPHGALIKLIIDQLESGEGVQVISPARGTGKTPKFIVQNTTNGANLKIVIRDDFSEAKTDDGSGHGNNTTRSNVKVLLGSIDNVYLQDMAGVITFESDKTTVNYTNTQTSANIETVDTSVTPKTFDSMTDEEIATEIAKESMDFHTKEVLLNKDDEKEDINENNVIFLKKVSAVINLVNSEKVLIFADYGKYNINNYDTIFSKNVTIEYLDKKINSEYLDFSIERKSMIISKNVIYKDIINSMKADVIELDLETKDIKIYMYDNNNKVLIKKN